MIACTRHHQTSWRVIAGIIDATRLDRVAPRVLRRQRFTEGFDTKDLQDAKALLEELR